MIMVSKSENHCLDVLANAEDHRAAAAAAATAAVSTVPFFLPRLRYERCTLSSLFLFVGMDSLHYNTARTNNSRCYYRFDGNRVLLLSATKEEDEVEDDHDTDDPRTIVGLLLLLPSRCYRFFSPVF